MNVLSLFAGIGGLELGLERAGMTTVGQVEINPYCRRVLAKHWPEVPKHDDVRTAVDWWTNTPCPACRGTGYMGGFIGDCWCKRLRRTDGGVSDTGIVHRPRVDVVCGGFPCQPFSSAGRRRGVADERWGWPWMETVVRAVRPRYVVVENVADLVRDSVAWGWLLGDLAAVGFDAEWGVLPACALGAAHSRERVFLVAYAQGDDVADQGQGAETARGLRLQPRGSRWRAHARSRRWLSEPALDRVADGVPRRLVVDELHALGNAVVPDVAEHIGRLIVTAELEAAS